MSSSLNRIENLGRREATTVATATTQRVFATLPDAIPAVRMGISVNNLDASAELYVRLAATSSGAPTVSATDNDLVVPPKTSRQILIGPRVEVYVRSNSAAAVNYTAMEWM